MAERQTATDDALTFETPDGTETVTVPETFTRDDYATYFGDVPDEWDTEVVFVFDGTLRAGAFVGDEWVEATYQTDETAPVFNASEHGWVVYTTDFSPEMVAGAVPGEVLWTADDGFGTCRREDCTGTIAGRMDAADLPDGLVFVACAACGTAYEYDETAGDLRINL